MHKRLSSILVPVYKLFPLLAVIGFLFNLPTLVSNNFPKDLLLGFLFLFIWGGFFYFATARWKIVYLLGDRISASGFFKKIEIPISEIRAIKASSWWGWQPRTIKITLKSKTEFGDEIIFVPRGFGYTATAEANELERWSELK